MATNLSLAARVNLLRETVRHAEHALNLCDRLSESDDNEVSVYCPAYLRICYVVLAAQVFTVKGNKGFLVASSNETVPVLDRVRSLIITELGDEAVESRIRELKLLRDKVFAHRDGSLSGYQYDRSEGNELVSGFKALLNWAFEIDHDEHVRFIRACRQALYSNFVNEMVTIDDH